MISKEGNEVIAMFPCDEQSHPASTHSISVTSEGIKIDANKCKVFWSELSAKAYTQTTNYCCPMELQL